MICVKNYENIFKFVEVTHTILQCRLFFPDTVYIAHLVKKNSNALVTLAAAVRELF